MFACLIRQIVQSAPVPPFFFFHTKRGAAQRLFFIFVSAFRRKEYSGLIIPKVLHDLQTFAEALEVHDLPFTQEPERIEKLRIIREGHQVLIGSSGFLLRYDHVRTTSHQKFQ